MIDFDLAAPPDKSPFWIANAGLCLMYRTVYEVSDTRYNELRLLIRHPSMGRLSPSPTFFAESMSICAEASRNILAIINRFRDFRQLECHPQVARTSIWFLILQSVSTIILASLTILYSLWEKKSETTKQEIEKEMQIPLDILAEIGQTYGPTRKLHQALATLVAATIENLERSRYDFRLQGVSFGSSIDPSIPRPMQLPVRIDSSLHFERPGTQPLARPPQAMLQAQPSVPPMGWQDLGKTIRPEASGISDGIVNAKGSDFMEPEQSSPTGGFDDAMLWGPSLEWTGGWDDFLNAIAM